MDHPAVIEAMRTGYAEKEPEVIGNDALGNEVYVGDEVYVLDGEMFLEIELGSQATEILELLGAERKTA